MAACDPLRTSPETEDLRRFSEAGENSPERYGQVSGIGFGLTPRRALRQDCHKVDTPAACALRGWRTYQFDPPLAIGERVGKAGPDLFRSPIKRCSHKRLSRCDSNAAVAARRSKC